MSTRRARIKAITALPPRRKNAESNENKPKEESAKVVIEKINSPKIQQIRIEQESSPQKIVPSSVNIRTPIDVACVNTPERVNYQAASAANKISTPQAAKVSVITSVSSAKPVFLSPQARNSPQRKVEVAKKQIRITHEAGKKQVTICSNTINSDAASNENKDHYNVPNVPEDTVMDGIIPLQGASSAPNPIDILKNALISDYAEVLFDPIVPLPSPSKVRPKLRPVPRLGPLRRNSVQGSASESEDENRRALLNSGGAATPTTVRQRNDSHTSHSTVYTHNRDPNRMRNDSVCSNMSQVTIQPALMASPVKEKHYSKTRKQERSRRMTALRRRRENTKRDTLTMYDLIFYNPTTKPIVADEDEIKAKEANQLSAKAEKKPEEAVDDPPANDSAPVPQMKLGPNGEIILDEQSLVIKKTADRQVSSVVREGAWSNTGGYYRRSAQTADWPDEETVRFYRALAALGTDFSMMEQLFPGRTRRDLKKKFKKEEKLNGAQVDKALKAGNLWDVLKLKEQFVAEREAAKKALLEQKEREKREKLAQKERQQTAKEYKMKHSKSSKLIGDSSVPAKYHKTRAPVSADDIYESLKTKNKQRYTNTDQTSQPPPQSVTNISAEKTHDVTAVLPKNIESGSLVVLSVEDPNAPTKKILQTYISAGGKLNPVSLPPDLLNSVVGYMNKSTPKSNLSVASSPSSVMSQEGRSTPGTVANSISPAKRMRHSSYSITQL